MIHQHPLWLSLLASGAALLLSAQARAELPAVVTDIPVVGALTQQVMGDLGNPLVLLETGGDAHHYQLRPSQARSLQNADLLIWVGPELSPWLVRASEGLGEHVSMPLLALPETRRLAYEADGEHDHDHAHDDEGHDHVHEGTDPHAWLDPDNGKAWLGAIAEALAARDPDNATTYRANAQAAIAQINQLDARLAEALAPAKSRHFVVFHDAYRYFTAHYGLEPAIAVSLGDASAPSAARLRQIQQVITTEQAVCAFPEANHDPKLMNVAIEGSPAQLGAVLDPEGATLPFGPTLYPTILEQLGTALADCLSAR